ncbi:hypothetical protein C9374_002128 [Naegleria lovaniensis]|uniref:Saccharopine dehydrogenase NADP binding domain-containing protein n=1 Tax=Naegleria lovaniensis TaxID=51637 RepID=A0AA88GVI5_NAELO|nr:uncharacterized protein C9374_002128 [Naegleria lovaniensis]KAG2387093.1 hypothetical protein C9374_002128 [Naegleria lovaniensis]
MIKNSSTPSPTTTTTSEEIPLTYVSSSDRKYDVTIFGATGFTGTLIVRYLIQRLERMDSVVNSRRFCIAGRNESKLNNLVTAHNINMSEKGLHHLIIDVMVIEKIEKGSPKLLDLTRNTKVLLNVAGPFIACGGLEIVESCVETRTDYLDITGEPEFVLESAAKFHEKAKENHVKIIHCCGFDSIPSDLGTNISLNMIKKKLEDVGVLSHMTSHNTVLSQSSSSSTPETIISTNGYLAFNLPGFVSYGTFNTLVTSLENYSIFSGKKTNEQQVQKMTKKKSYSKRGTKYHTGLQHYIIPFSTSDPLIVRRSNFLIGYESKFSSNPTPPPTSSNPSSSSDRVFEYNNYLQISNLYYLFLMYLFFLVMLIMTRFSFGAQFLRFLYSLKKNPTQQQRDESSFDFVFETFGRVQDATTSEPVLFKCKTRVFNNNDPGYTETAVYALDSALFLLTNPHAQTASPGVVTPGAVFGVESCGDEYLKCLGQHTTLKYDFVEFKYVKASNKKEYEELKKEVSQFLKLD